MIQPFQTVGITASTDEIGIRTITVPFIAETLDDALNYGEQSFQGLPKIRHEVTQDENGWFSGVLTYQGQQSEPGAGDPPKVYSLQSSYEEEPIESHPRLKELMEKYSGSKGADGRVQWAEEIESENKSRGFGKAEESSTKPNPMFGVEKWKKLSVIWTVTYAARTIPGDALNRIGRTLASPPGNPPKLAGRSRWLAMPVRATKRGNVAEITEEFLLLDDSQPDDLYRPGE
jgi:hypothetical protein